MNQQTLSPGTVLDNNSGSNDIDVVAWYRDNSGDRTHRVRQKQPNKLGLYDMSGNVWEWCSDWYDSGYYKNFPSKDPEGPSSGTRRVLRGGSWFNIAYYSRTAFRRNILPENRNYDIGFRLVCIPLV